MVQSTEDSLNTIAEEIRDLYASDPGNAERLLEDYLERKLEGFSLEDRISHVGRVSACFRTRKPEGIPSGDRDDNQSAHLLAILLGEKISGLDPTTPETSRKLAASLNRVFDNLSDLVTVIRTTLLGKDPCFQTIRHIISADLKGEQESKSLEAHLRQIKGAFLITREAFRTAARTEVARILDELDPEKIAGGSEKGLKFGFMRRADLFEIYKEKYDDVRKWFASERFLEDFIREFEKVCRRLVNEKGGLYENA